MNLVIVSGSRDGSEAESLGFRVQGLGLRLSNGVKWLQFLQRVTRDCSIPGLRDELSSTPLLEP